MTNFELGATTTKALESRGIKKLFPIQGATFGPVSEGRDLIGRARTGTGKTLAFSLPIIDKLVKASPQLHPFLPCRPFTCGAKGSPVWRAEAHSARTRAHTCSRSEMPSSSLGVPPVPPGG